MAEKIMGVASPASPATGYKLSNGIAWVTGVLGFVGGLSTGGLIANPLNNLATKLRVDALASKVGIGSGVIRLGLYGAFLTGLIAIAMAIMRYLGKWGRPLGAALLGYVLGTALMFIINAIVDGSHGMKVI